MRTKAGILILAALSLAAACGTTPDANGPASPTTRDPDKVPTATAPKAPTTTAPKATVKDTPECKAYAQFSFAQSSMSFANAEQAAQISATYSMVADTAITTIPQFATQITRIKELTLKQATGELTEAEKTEYQTAFEPISTWYKDTCVIEPEAG